VRKAVKPATGSEAASVKLTPSGRTARRSAGTATLLWSAADWRRLAYDPGDILPGAPALGTARQEPQLAAVQGEGVHLDNRLVFGRGRLINLLKLRGLPSLRGVHQSQHLATLLVSSSSNSLSILCLPDVGHLSSSPPSGAFQYVIKYPLSCFGKRHLRNGCRRCQLNLRNPGLDSLIGVVH
jgi:hypothetical protein